MLAYGMMMFVFIVVDVAAISRFDLINIEDIHQREPEVAGQL